MNAIDVKRLTHTFGTRDALRNVDMTVAQGSVYALLGRNGAGKTTLLQIIMGLRVPTYAQRLDVFGRPVHQLSVAERAHITYVAEGLKLPQWMSLDQLKRFAAPLYESWSCDVANDLQARFDLDPRKPIRSLSRGDQIKSALLIAIAARPRLLLLDEPFTGIDVISKDDIVRGVLATASAEGCTVVIASHDLAEVEFIADTVGFLNGSRLNVADSFERLQERFRRVEVITDTADQVRLPANAHLPEQAGRRISFVLERAETRPESEEVRALIPGAREIAVRPATLREMFTVIAGSAVVPRKV